MPVGAGPPALWDWACTQYLPMVRTSLISPYWGTFGITFTESFPFSEAFPVD